MNPTFDVVNYFAQDTLSETRDWKARRQDSSITYPTVKVSKNAVLGMLMTDGVYELFNRVVKRHCSDLPAKSSLPIAFREELDLDTAQSIREQISRLIDDAKCFHSSQYHYRNHRGFEIELPRRLEFRDELIEYFRVGADDPRVNLRGQRGVRATKFIPVNTLLGIYRGLMLPAVVVERNLFQNPRDGWEGTVEEWKTNVGKYLLEVPVAFQTREVSCDISAFEYENPGSFINDPRIDPFAEKKYSPEVLDGTKVLFKDDEEHFEMIREPNVILLTVKIAAFPFPFLLTVRSICSGEELLLDYGYDHFRNGGRTSAVNAITNGFVDNYPM